MIPKVIIKYNRFLDPIFIDWVNSQKKFKGTVVPSPKIVFRNIKKYNQLWVRWGGKIMKAITKETGLKFERNQIDVHVVSVNPRSFSNPIIIKSRHNDTDFINVVTHEIIHCLFSDNHTLVNRHIPWVQEIKDRDTCNDHVILHALLKHIYLDVLKSPKNLRRNILLSNLPGNEGYARAWEIVEGTSYKEIIKEFRRRLKE